MTHAPLASDSPLPKGGDDKKIGIIGTGIMGSGIAQLAAVHGWTVALLDVSPEVVERALAEIDKRLKRMVEKNHLAPDERDQTRRRLRAATSPADLAAGCDLILEAVSEDLAVKTKVLTPIAEQASPQTIFASNTSSLSITHIGQAIGRGARTVGMHFFNPPWLMPLVEVIAGRESEPTAVDQVAGIAGFWGKTVVRAKDTPGFIVNRVARGYYLEALRILGERIAPIPEVDRTMKQLGGFKLGPFELMDLVGIDVNYSVSTSVWEQLGRPARLTPHPIQAELHDRGQLGRKTQGGFYDYSVEPPVPALDSEPGPFAPPDAIHQAVSAFVQHGADRPGVEKENYIFARILATILNEAALAYDEAVASREDIDTAMRLGTNYPRGPLEWADRIGKEHCGRMLLALNASVSDDRFRPAAYWPIRNS
jgi:3-hydroxybutyryl-CoA dehydrogenase